jgi:hypothetical protein
MRLIHGLTIAAAVAMLAPTVVAQDQEASRVVAGGGILVPGWAGKPDTGSVSEAKFAAEGSGFHVTTGPAITYWNPANKAAGNYTVKATFNEPQYMNLNDHPHPYGIMIAGNDLGTASASLLYCAPYGSGKFIVRGFGPAPFQMNGRNGEPSDAVHKAAGKDQPVTQDVAMSVTGDKVECAINGTVVASYDKTALVAAGKLKSLDGVYGMRFAHNTEVIVTGFGMTKN